jgi:hypothetical protein
MLLYLGMNTDNPNQIIVRIFVGIEVNFEIKMRLNESLLWKDALILASKEPKIIKIVPFQNKNYIGRFLNFKEVTLKDLDQEANQIVEELLGYCPALKITKNDTLVFSQVFVA